MLEYVKKALWLCITTLIYIFFVGRFLQILWLAFIALIALVALLIALYGFLYGEKGLRATWWFFAKWGCKILLVGVLVPTSVIMCTLASLHVCLTVFFIYKPGLIDHAKFSVFMRPIYSWFHETYVPLIKYGINLVICKHQQWGESYKLPSLSIDHLTDFHIILLVTICLCGCTCVCFILLAIFKNLVEFYSAKGDAFLVWIYKVIREQEREEKRQEERARKLIKRTKEKVEEEKKAISEGKDGEEDHKRT